MSNLLIGSIIYASLTVFTLLLILLHRRMTYWRRRGISHRSPNLIFGNLLGVFGERSLRGILQETHKTFQQTGEVFCGFFWLTEPTVFVLNKQLAFQILSDEKSFSMNAPIPGRSLYNYEGFEAGIDNACYNAKAFKEVFHDADMANININLACKMYIENVIDSIFSGKEERRRNAIKTVHSQKWNYILQNFSYKKNCDTDALEAQAFYRDICGTLLCCILFKLGCDRPMQRMLYDEMTQTLEENRKLTYECLKKAMCFQKQISDVFKWYAPFSHALLQATQDYTTNQVGYTIEQRSLVLIPIAAMELSDQSFEQCLQSHQLSKAAFGNFGMLLIFTALMLILRDYELSANMNTPQKLTFRDTFPYSTLDTAVYLSVRKR